MMQVAPYPKSFRCRVLIVEDNDRLRQRLQRELALDPQLEIDSSSDGTAALEKLLQGKCGIIITALRTPRINGLELIRNIQQRGLRVTIIVTTRAGDLVQVDEAFRLGAHDFLTRPIAVEGLWRVLRRAMHARQLQNEAAYLRAELRARHACHNIITHNPRMHAVVQQIDLLADSASSVLIEGETGTGKELVARAIHYTSRRRRGHLVTVRCGALPQDLLERELFGPEQAFWPRHPGLEMAQGGTLFLDEVGDLDPRLQARLLRVLNGERGTRPGASQNTPLDVRLIAATRRSLWHRVQQAGFLENLYEKLRSATITLPPLRERREDIPLLVEHFLEKQRGLRPMPRVAPAATEVLLNYAWPGNVRQLENAIERACVTCQNRLIQPENLPVEIVRSLQPSVMRG